MKCYHCKSTNLLHLKDKTSLGCEQYRCRECNRRFNERTGTRFNRLQYPADIVMLAVLYYIKYKLSYRDVSEIFLERGFQICHEEIRRWAILFSGDITLLLRKRRKKKSTGIWHTDETYITVKGVWKYLYRCIDNNGELVDCYLSNRRNAAAATQFFKGTRDVIKKWPREINTDGHCCYAIAVKRVLPKKIKHNVLKNKNNMIEQSHRQIKQWYYPMKGFGNFDVASMLCNFHEEVNINNLFRPTKKRNQYLSLNTRREIFLERLCVFKSLFA